MVGALFILLPLCNYGRAPTKGRQKLWQISPEYSQAPKDLLVSSGFPPPLFFLGGGGGGYLPQGWYSQSNHRKIFTGCSSIHSGRTKSGGIAPPTSCPAILSTHITRICLICLQDFAGYSMNTQRHVMDPENGLHYPENRRSQNSGLTLVNTKCLHRLFQGAKIECVPALWPDYSFVRH